MVHKKQPPDTASYQLRQLRELSGKTQLDVELDAKLGIGYLQRLELGKVQKPQYDTLDRILYALDAPYDIKRHIMNLFGYQIDFSIPTDTEIKTIASEFKTVLQETPLPCYLLDYTHRVCAWNALADEIFDFSSIQLNSASSMCLPELLFALPAIQSRIKNPDEFYLAQIRVLKYEQIVTSDHESSSAFIQKMQQYPLFVKYWEQFPDHVIAIPARPLCLLKIQVKYELKHFRLMSELYGYDSRFRVMYLVPYGQV